MKFTSYMYERFSQKYQDELICEVLIKVVNLVLSGSSKVYVAEFP